MGFPDASARSARSPAVDRWLGDDLSSFELGRWGSGVLGRVTDHRHAYRTVTSTGTPHFVLAFPDVSTEALGVLAEWLLLDFCFDRGGAACQEGRLYS